MSRTDTAVRQRLADRVFAALTGTDALPTDDRGRARAVQKGPDEEEGRAEEGVATQICQMRGVLRGLRGEGDTRDRGDATADDQWKLQSRVSTAVSSLVERGWAQTASDPSDGRRTLVFAPDHIRQEADRGLNAETRTLDQLLEGRTPARRKVILAALDELLDVLRAEPATTSAMDHR